MGESMSIIIVTVGCLVGGLVLAFIASSIGARRRRELASRQRFQR